MEYTIVSLTTKDEITLFERKDYSEKLWGNRSKSQKGFMTKFIKALDLVESKQDELYTSIITNPFQDEIAKFYLKDKDLAKKWKKFLTKVFPQLEITVSQGTKYTLEEWMLSDIFSSLQDTPVTIEFTLPRRPTSEEISKITEMIEQIKTPNLYYLGKIYDRTSYGTVEEGEDPWFFELDYHYKWEYSSQFQEVPGVALCSDCMEPTDQDVICKKCETLLNKNLLFKINVEKGAN